MTATHGSKRGAPRRGPDRRPGAPDFTTLEGDALVTALGESFECADTVIHTGGRTWRVLRPRAVDDLLDEDAYAIDGRIPYWAELWASTPVLADYLSHQPGHGRPLLELGCGVGLLALVAQAAGYRVLATDYYAEALAFVRANAHLNAVHAPEVRVVDWRSLPADLEPVERILGADVLYEAPLVDVVLAAIGRLLTADGVATLADPRRQVAARLIDRAPIFGLDVDVRTLANEHGDPATIDVYTLRRLGVRGVRQIPE